MSLNRRHRPQVSRPLQSQPRRINMPIGPVELLILLAAIGIPVGIVFLVIAVAGSNRRSAQAQYAPPAQLLGPKPPAAPPPAASVAPPLGPAQFDDRLERLQTLVSLRDSGVLSPQEFEAEKVRILSHAVT
jgi:hypothetical protein